MIATDDIIGKNQRDKPLAALVACPIDNHEFLTREDVVFDNLDLGYLYTFLENLGYPVALFDSLRLPAFFGSPYDRLAEKIHEAQPTYVVFSDPIFTFDKSLKLSRRLKDQSPDLTIIYCGQHASLYYDDILSNESHVDFVISGDGEFTLLRLIEILENGGNLSGIPGLAWRNKGSIEACPPDFDINLDKLPFPHRPSLSAVNPNRRQFYNLSSSRGCPGHCTYCVTSAFLNRYCPAIHRWRFRSPQHIFDEIQYLYEQGVRRFFFADDNWIGNREIGLERIVELCQLIIDSQLDISFTALVRPDSLVPSDIDTLLIMKEAGLTGLSLGLEAAHPDQLKRFGKKVDLGCVKELVDLLNKNNILMRCGFIMFFPYSTFDMLRANGSFLEETGLSYMFPSYFSSLNALSALPIEKRLRRDNLLIRPTSYKAPGEYRYPDERINALRLFLLSTMMAESETIYTMLIAFIEAYNQPQKENNSLKTLLDSRARIGQASADLFAFSLETFENSSDPVEASGISYLYSQSWSKVLEKERGHFERYLDNI